MSHHLTPNGVAITKATTLGSRLTIPVVLQIISMKQMPGAESAHHPRYRVELSDGIEIVFGILGVEEVSLAVQQGLVGVGSIVKIMGTMNSLKDMM
jgi:hypothetical protein